LNFGEGGAPTFLPQSAKRDQIKSVNAERRESRCLIVDSQVLNEIDDVEGIVKNFVG